MSTYLITVSVTASGWQQFKVEAQSEEQAREQFECGNCEFHEEELHADIIKYNTADIRKLEP